MLRDMTTVNKHQPYSWSRVQLAWWSVIILSCFITIIIVKGTAPTLDISTVILLGISAATTATAKAIDISDAEKNDRIRNQDDFGRNFFLDILSDGTGVSVHRFQTVVFNCVFGIWFMDAFLQNLLKGVEINAIIPPIANNNLILLGVSSATYAALKATENQTATIEAKNRVARQVVEQMEDVSSIQEESVVLKVPKPASLNYTPGRKRTGNI
jgi:hypothetical protein